MDILIATMEKDLHALCVSLALKHRKHHCSLWITPDFPQCESHVYSINPKSESWIIQGSNFYHAQDRNFDVIWLRRPRKPILSQALHPEDRESACFENNLYFQSLWSWISPDAFWINSFEASRRANHKILQLKAAKKVGFAIPDTLISNDPYSIKQFLQKHIENKVIYKSFRSMRWEEAQCVRVGYTKEVALKDLPSNVILKNMIGIFQEKIEKQYELRVTCMGERLIAVKIDSQVHQEGKYDWRRIPPEELSLEQVYLPDEIKVKCLKFMREMGLIFGCFDLVVTTDNQYYFLEINEQGQFLWIEEIQPTIPMLDTFIHFITKETNIRHQTPLQLSMFLEEAECILN